MSRDISIDNLEINVNAGEGQEHRIGLLAKSAAAILAARLGAGLEGGRERALRPAQPGGAALDLEHMTDSEAASALADTWMHSLNLKRMS